VLPYKSSVAFSVLSGTIKAVDNAHRGLADPGGGAFKDYPSHITPGTQVSDDTLWFRTVWGVLTVTDPSVRHRKLLETLQEHLPVQS